MEPARPERIDEQDLVLLQAARSEVVIAQKAAQLALDIVVNALARKYRFEVSTRLREDGVIDWGPSP